MNNSIHYPTIKRNVSFDRTCKMVQKKCQTWHLHSKLKYINILKMSINYVLKKLSSYPFLSINLCGQMNQVYSMWSLPLSFDSMEILVSEKTVCKKIMHSVQYAPISGIPVTLSSALAQTWSSFIVTICLANATVCQLCKICLDSTFCSDFCSGILFR